jgi:acetyl esterase/lipase
VPLRNLYKKYFAAVVNHNESYTQLIEHRPHRNNKFRVIKCFGDKSESDILLVWFHGGSFIQEKYDNILPFLVEISKTTNIHVITFDYPLLYHTKLHETLEFINLLLADYFSENKYKYIFYGGDSAGTYLALKTIEIEFNNSLRNITKTNQIEIIPSGFIGICGFYDPTFGNKPLAPFFINTWFWRVPNMINFKKCTLTTPALIITSSRDFLATQSQRFVDTQPRRLIKYKQFTTPNSLHCFVANTLLPETQETLGLIKDFINAQTS